VTDLVLNPDVHAGYGAPVDWVLTSPTHVYPSPVGVDIKCSMSFLQLDLPGVQLADRPLRRALINAILERTPTGPDRGQRSVRKARKAGKQLGVRVATDGASPEVCHALGIPMEWAQRCELPRAWPRRFARCAGDTARPIIASMSSPKWIMARLPVFCRAYAMV
jgi:tRNA-splicing ligase RtcB